MFDAQLLISTGTPYYSVFSPWFPRGGDILRATGELVQDGGATVTIRVFTKNSEDTGDGVDVNPDTTIGLSGSDTRETAEWKVNTTSQGAGGLEELVRYQFTVTGSAGTWILLRMLSPVWFDAVKA